MTREHRPFPRRERQLREFVVLGGPGPALDSTVNRRAESDPCRRGDLGAGQIDRAVGNYFSRLTSIHTFRRGSAPPTLKEVDPDQARPRLPPLPTSRTYLAPSDQRAVRSGGDRRKRIEAKFVLRLSISRTPDLAAGSAIATSIL